MMVNDAFAGETRDRSRLLQLDVLKALAIISLILLGSSLDLRKIFYVYHILQAVPLLILAVGIETALFYKYNFPYSLGLGSLYNANRKKLLAYIAFFFISVLFLALYWITSGYLTVGMIVGYFDDTALNYILLIIAQLVALLPLVYTAYRKYPLPVLVSSVALNIAFEFIAPYISIFHQSHLMYVACILRYLILVIVAIVLAEKLEYYQIGEKADSLPGCAIWIFSLVYLSYYELMGFYFPWFFVTYTGEPLGFVSFAYAIYIVIAGLLWLPERTKNVVVNVFGLLGRSWYFTLGVFLIYHSSAIYPNVIGLGLADYANALLGVVTCQSVGLILYLVFKRMSGTMYQPRDEVVAQ